MATETLFGTLRALLKTASSSAKSWTALLSSVSTMTRNTVASVFSALGRSSSVSRVPTPAGFAKWAAGRLRKEPRCGSATQRRFGGASLSKSVVRRDFVCAPTLSSAPAALAPSRRVEFSQSQTLGAQSLRTIMKPQTLSIAEQPSLLTRPITSMRAKRNHKDALTKL